MAINNTEYIAQVLPIPEPLLGSIKRLSQTKPIQLFVASENALKREAAANALTKFIHQLFTTHGFNAQSGINEQPVDEKNTQFGAIHRLSHLELLAKPSLQEDALHIYVSMENGIFQEQVAGLKNPDLFLDEKRKCTWVDRCYVIVRIAHKSLPSSALGSSLSRGVTVPVSAVESSEKSGWNKTCGSFIEQQFKFNAKDWHSQMAGVGRKELMEEAILAALNNVRERPYWPLSTT